MVGKLLNAGQTCIAPDYALVPERNVDALVAAVEKASGRAVSDADATIRTTRRSSTSATIGGLTALVDDARAQGARVIVLNPAQEAPDPSSRKLFPTLIVGATEAMAVMREEIFGPLLPIETYAALDDAIAQDQRAPASAGVLLFRTRRRGPPQGPGADDRRWRHRQRHAVALRAREPAVRRRRCVGHRRLPRRSGLPHVHAPQAGVHAAARRRGEAALSAVRQDLRKSARAAATIERLTAMIAGAALCAVPFRRVPCGSPHGRTIASGNPPYTSCRNPAWPTLPFRRSIQRPARPGWRCRAVHATRTCTCSARRRLSVRRGAAVHAGRCAEGNAVRAAPQCSASSAA